MNELFVAVRRIVAPIALAGVTVVGTLGWTSVAHAAGRAESPAASGEADTRSAPSHPHSVTSGLCGCAAAAGARGSWAGRAVGSSFRTGASRAGSFAGSSHAFGGSTRGLGGSTRAAALPAHGGYGASSGSAHSARNYRSR